MKEKFTTVEPDLPDTLFVRDIESKVFQMIAMQVIAKIEGVHLAGGNILDSFLGREGLEGLRSIHVEQDAKKQTVKLKIDINIDYGYCLPEKAEEVQTLVSREVSSLTGLQVSSVYVVFKGLVLPKSESSSEEFDESRRVVSMGLAEENEDTSISTD